MWSSKRPNATQAAWPEPGNVQTKQPVNPSPAILEAMTQENMAPMRPTGAITDGGVARVGPALQVKGEISGREDLLIDGLVEGNVKLERGKLTICRTAKVTADITDDEVVVGGHLKGNVNAKSRVEIKKDSSVTGDLTTAQIAIEDGAYFRGSVEIYRDAEKPADTYVSSQTAPH